MGDYPWSVSLDEGWREPRSSLSASLDSGVVRRTRRTRRPGDGRGTGRGRIPHPGGPRRRGLRRVVPIVQTKIGGVIIILLSLDDYAEGFAVRLRLLLADDHPVAEEQRRQNAEFHHRRAEAVRRGCWRTSRLKRRRPSSAGTEEVLARTRGAAGSARRPRAAVPLLGRGAGVGFKSWNCGRSRATPRRWTRPPGSCG